MKLFIQSAWRASLLPLLLTILLLALSLGFLLREADRLDAEHLEAAAEIASVHLESQGRALADNLRAQLTRRNAGETFTLVPGEDFFLFSADDRLVSDHAMDRETRTMRKTLPARRDALIDAWSARDPAFTSAWAVVFLPEPALVALQATRGDDPPGTWLAAQPLEMPATWADGRPPDIEARWISGLPPSPGPTSDPWIQNLSVPGIDGGVSGYLHLKTNREHHHVLLRFLRGFAPILILVLASAAGVGWWLHRLYVKTRRDLQEHSLETALRSISAGTWQWNEETHAATWNTQMRRLHGVDDHTPPSEEVWLSCIHPDDRADVIRETMLARQKDHSNLRYRVILPDGTTRWLHSVAEVGNYPQKRPVRHWHGIVFDVTDSEQAREQIRLNESRYRAIVETQTDIVCRWKPDTTLTFANTEYLALFGISPTDVGVRRWIDFIPESERAAVTAVYEDLARHPRQLIYEHHAVAANGQMRWLMWIDVPILDRNNVCIEFQSVGRDITDRKHYEEALRDSEERYRQIVDTALEGIWMVDRHFRTTFVNQRMADLLGYPVDTMIGRPLREFLGENGDEWIARLIEKDRQVPREQHELRFFRSDKRPLWTLVSTSLFYDPEGQFTGGLGLVTDITSRKAAETDLAAREALFRTVFESSPLGLALFDLDGRTNRVNPALARMLGYSEQELLDLSVPEVSHPDDLPTDAEQFQRLTRGDIDRYSLEKRLRHRDGSDVWIRLSCSRTSGPQPMVVAVADDITARRKSDTAMRTLVERTATSVGETFIMQMVRQLAEVLEVDFAFTTERLADDVVHCIASHRRNGTALNEQCTECANRTCQTILDGNMCVHNDDASMQGCPIFHALSDLHIRGFLAIPLFDSKGRVIGSLGVMHGSPIRNLELAKEMLQVFALRTSAEIERRRHDAELEALTRNLESRVNERTAQLTLQALAMDTTLEGMAVLREDAYIYMNEPHAAMYGYHPAELIGETWKRLYAESEQERILQEAFPVLAREGRWRGEVEGRRKDGTLFATEISLALSRDKHLVCACRDISIAKAAQRTIDERSLMLERASRAKDDFLASMSHELRTPLAGILMIAESLRRYTYGPLNQRQAAVLAHLEESGHHLLDLINDVLDLSKIEAGKLELTVERLAVSDLFDSILRMVRESVHKKNLRLEIAIDPPGLQVAADARRLKQMLLNLMSNAVKFTPAGGQIALRARLSDDERHILFAVSDTGIGIARSEFDKLFRPFVQLDSGLNRQYGGTGLGLPLVLRMAELHHGGLYVDSEPGQGSTFTIKLPLHAPNAAPLPVTRPADPVAPVPPPGTCTGRILVVEDNEITLHVLSHYLHACGYDVRCAASGTEAVVDAVKHPPDLILMDIQMPAMDGFEATRLIRGQSDTRIARVPVIALTALAMPGDRERCQLAGMNHYLTKPIRMDNLVESIEWHIRRPSRPSDGATPS